MTPEELYLLVVKNKKYQKFPKDFIMQIISFNPDKDFRFIRQNYIWHYLLHNMLLFMPNRKLFKA